MDAVSWRSRFLSISCVYFRLHPSPEPLPNCPICRTGCTFIPKRAHNSPWTLLTFYKMPEIPPPCQLLTCTHRYLPVSAHLPRTWRRPQSFPLTLLSQRQFMYRAMQHPHVPIWTRHDWIQPTMPVVWITRHVQSSLELILCNLFVQIHSLLLWSVLFFFLIMYIFFRAPSCRAKLINGAMSQ